MTVKTCVYCKFRYKRGSKISLHRFPTNLKERSKWLNNMKAGNWTPGHAHYLCSDHFETKYHNIHYTRISLRHGSVPTIFNGHFIAPKSCVQREMTISATESAIEEPQLRDSWYPYRHAPSKASDLVNQSLWSPKASTNIESIELPDEFISESTSVHSDEHSVTRMAIKAMPQAQHITFNTAASRIIKPVELPDEFMSECTSVHSDVHTPTASNYPSPTAASRNIQPVELPDEFMSECSSVHSVVHSVTRMSDELDAIEVRPQAQRITLTAASRNIQPVELPDEFTLMSECASEHWDVNSVTRIAIEASPQAQQITPTANNYPSPTAASRKIQPVELPDEFTLMSECTSVHSDVHTPTASNYPSLTAVSRNLQPVELPDEFTLMSECASVHSDVQSVTRMPIEARPQAQHITPTACNYPFPTAASTNVQPVELPDEFMSECSSVHSDVHSVTRMAIKARPQAQHITSNTAASRIIKPVELPDEFMSECSSVHSDVHSVTRMAIKAQHITRTTAGSRKIQPVELPDEFTLMSECASVHSDINSVTRKAIEARPQAQHITPTASNYPSPTAAPRNIKPVELPDESMSECTSVHSFTRKAIEARPQAQQITSTASNYLSPTVGSRNIQPVELPDEFTLMSECASVHSDINSVTRVADELDTSEARPEARHITPTASKYSSPTAATRNIQPIELPDESMTECTSVHSFTRKAIEARSQAQQITSTASNYLSPTAADKNPTQALYDDVLIIDDNDDLLKGVSDSTSERRTEGPVVFSWDQLSVVVPCDSEYPLDTETTLYEEKRAKPINGAGCEESAVPAVHEGYRCDVCRGDIVGFRYVCVQCMDYDVCVACEAGGAHAVHYVLRVPGLRPHTEVLATLRLIRRALLSDSVVPVEGAGELDIKKEDVKEKRDDDDVIEQRNDDITDVTEQRDDDVIELPNYNVIEQDSDGRELSAVAPSTLQTTHTKMKRPVEVKSKMSPSSAKLTSSELLALEIPRSHLEQVDSDAMCYLDLKNKTLVKLAKVKQNAPKRTVKTVTKRLRDVRIMRDMKTTTYATNLQEHINQVYVPVCS